MADFSSGSTVLTKKPKRDLNKCIFCQQKKKGGEIKLTSTADGIRRIIEGSEKLKDGLLDNLNEEERQCIKYHVKNCHSQYVLKANRQSSSYVNEDVVSSTSTPVPTDVPSKS